MSRAIKKHGNHIRLSPLQAGKMFTAARKKYSPQGLQSSGGPKKIQLNANVTSCATAAPPPSGRGKHHESMTCAATRMQRERKPFLGRAHICAFGSPCQPSLPLTQPHLVSSSGLVRFQLTFKPFHVEAAYGIKCSGGRPHPTTHCTSTPLLPRASCHNATPLLLSTRCLRKSA